MAEVRIRCRRNGPLLVEGPVELVDSQGNPLTMETDKPGIALCRCGSSGRKPFCDGSHVRIGWSEDSREQN